MVSFSSGHPVCIRVLNFCGEHQGDQSGVDTGAVPADRRRWTHDRSDQSVAGGGRRGPDLLPRECGEDRRRGRGPGWRFGAEEALVRAHGALRRFEVVHGILDAHSISQPQADLGNRTRCIAEDLPSIRRMCDHAQKRSPEKHIMRSYGTHADSTHSTRLDSIRLDSTGVFGHQRVGRTAHAIEASSVASSVTHSPGSASPPK